MTLLLGTIKKYKWWLIGAVVIIAGLWLYAGRKEKPGKEYKKETTELKQADEAVVKLIDALKQSMTQTDKLIELHEQTTQVLLSKISANNSLIKQDKLRTNEKINRVRQYDNADIQRYFAGLDTTAQ